MGLIEDIATRLQGIELTPEQMHEYQHRAVEFLWQNPFSALFVDMGLGKTVMAATVVARLMERFETGLVLIIAPLKATTNTWPDELAKWSHTAWINRQILREDDDDPRIIGARRETRERMRAQLRIERSDLSISEIAAEAEKHAQKAETEARRQIRASLAQSQRSIHIINRENTDWLVNLHRHRWPYRTVIVDESHSFQSHRSNRFKALQKVRQTPGLITRLHELTATPAAEGYQGVFAQAYLLDLGERLGKNITAYRKRYFSFDPYTHKFELRPEADDEILAKLAEVVMVMKADDYLPREKPTIQPRYVRLSPQAMVMYRSMERTMVLKLGEDEIEAETASALDNKLRQMASGVLWETRLEDTEDGGLAKRRLVHDIHDDKLDMLREIVDEMEGRSLLVAYHYKPVLAKLQRAFPKAVTMDPAGKAMKPWNKGEIPLMFIHPQSGGDSLNLQKGGSTLVFFDIPASLVQFTQLIGRLDRQGQQHPVLVQALVSRGTRDESLWAALLGKRDAEDEFYRKLKAQIRRLRDRLERGETIEGEL